MSTLFTKKVGLIALGVLVLILVGGGAYFMGKNGQAEPTPTPTEMPTPTAQQSPTPTDTPTPTVKPTAMPRPTATPTPANTPTPTPTPGVVNIETSVDPTTSNSCTKTFNFTAKIYTNAAVTVTYRWVRSDNGTGATQTLTFGSASMQTVTASWNRGQASGTTDNAWERIEILTPNAQFGNKAEFTHSCP